MTLHLFAGRRRVAVAAGVVAAALVAGPGLGPAYAAPAPGSAPTLNIADGDTLDGTVRLVADAAVENDPVVDLAVDGTSVADAESTVGTAHLEFDMGGNGTEKRYHNYLTVNGHTEEAERIYFPDVAGGERGDLAFPGAWLHAGENTITVHAGANWVDTTNTAAVGYEQLPNGEGGRCPNHDDFSLSSLSLSLLGLVADGEQNLFSYSFGDGTCGSSTKLLKQDLTFVVTGDRGTGGLAADLDTTTLSNGDHTVTATAESGARTSVTVEVNNAPAGSPRVTPVDGALISGTQPVIGALPVGSAGAVDALSLDGEPAQNAETLAAGTSTISFTVLAGNSLEARYHNFLRVNGHRIDIGGDYGAANGAAAELVSIEVPNRFLALGDNQVDLVTGDYNSGSGASLCANHDDFKVSGPALALGGEGTVAEGTHYTVSAGSETPTTGTFTLGDGTCGAVKDAEFHFTIEGAPTTRTIDTLGSGENAHLRFFVGGNGADSGFLNKVVINGIPMDMGIWEKEVADLSFPNEWLVPGINVIELVGGIDPATVAPTCPDGNLDDFTLRDFELAPADALATRLTRHVAGTNVTIGSSTYPAGSQVTVFIGDGSCGSSYNNTTRKEILFEVTDPDGSPASPRGLRADVDTTTIADGVHTVAATAGDNTASRRFSVDNSAPTVASSVPAAGQRLTANVALDVQLADASGVAGTPVITLDGAPVALGATIGHGLTAGDHVLAVTAVDSLGNRATREVRFTSASIPDVPTDLTSTVDGDSATLSAVIPGEDGTDLQATFTRADVVIPSEAYQGTATAVPTQLDVRQDTTVVAVRALQPGDDRSVETPSSGDVVFQRYDLTVPASEQRPTLRWEGVVDPARLVSLRVWQPAGQQWVVLTSARGAADGATVLTTQVGDAYRDGGTVHVMVTGEDPFADDLAPRDATAKDDKDHFEDPSDYDFSIAHFTDTQYLSEGAAGGTYNDWDGRDEPTDVQASEEQALWAAAYRNTTEWVAQNAEERKIAYTAHTGDIIENDYHNPLATGVDGQLLRPGLDEQVRKELEVSSGFQAVLDSHGVVNQVIAGNHDNQLGSETGPDSRFSQTFSPERYYQASRLWPDGAEYHTWDEETAPDGTVTTPGRDSQNNYVLFSAGGLDFVAVGLSYGVSPAEARWADSVFDRFHDRNGILLSHDYLVPSKNKDGRGAAFSNPDGSLLYKQVVESNPNVFLVLAGHEHGVATNLKTRIGATVAHNVVELLADYQFYTVSAGQLWPDRVDGSGNVDVDGNGTVDHKATDRLQLGASFLRLMQIDVERGEMSVDTYSPFLDEFGATSYDIRADGSQTTPRYNGAEDNMVLPVDLSSRTTSFSSESLAAFVPIEALGTEVVTAGASASVTWDGLRPGRSYGWFVTASSADGGTAVAQPSVFRTGRVDTTVSADPVTVAYGSPATVTARIASDEAVDGTVTVSEGAAVLGTGEAVDGVASVRLPAGLEPGRHQVTVSYAGNDALRPAETSAVVTVLPATARVQATAGPVETGDRATVSVTVDGGGTPATGTVEVMEGSTPLGTGTLSGGAASVQLPADLGVGVHQLRVVYSGNGRLSAASTTLTLTVESRRTVVSASAAPVAEGTAGSVSVTVDGRGVRVTGTVTVREGTATLGTATLTGSTAAVRLPADLAPGSHVLTVEYSGTDRLRSSSTEVTLVVEPKVLRDSTVEARPTPKKVKQGHAFKVRIAVRAGSVTPTGRVVVGYRGEQVGAATLVDGVAVVRVAGGFGRGQRSFTARYLGSEDVKAGSDSFTVTFTKKNGDR
ncbi:Ig-like domain repeat protein [Nocardioides caricicola]|uniref:Ig-like domain repeat protein n=1 Tax=Nocardioides caricicola TaxID=634770 RepID=A0ABW0MV46_9ACTN